MPKMIYVRCHNGGLDLYYGLRRRKVEMTNCELRTFFGTLTKGKILLGTSQISIVDLYAIFQHRKLMNRSFIIKKFDVSFIDVTLENVRHNNNLRRYCGRGL